MTKVPLKLVPDEDPQMFLPFVVVEVDGVPVEALLDSGASRTQLLERPGLSTSDGPHRLSVGAFGAQTAPVRYAVVSCRIGGLDVGAVEVSVVPSGHPGAENLVGQDILGQFRCGYRLSDALLILDCDPPNETRAISLDERRHVYLDLSWVRHEAVASAVFDTGASVTVVDQAFARRHPDLFTPEDIRTGTDATGMSAKTPMATMRGPQILGEHFADALVAIVDLSGANSTLQRSIDVILGWTAISQADWFVDHPRACAACAPLPGVGPGHRDAGGAWPAAP
jgi:hypothetical protein